MLRFRKLRNILKETSWGDKEEGLKLISLNLSCGYSNLPHVVLAFVLVLVGILFFFLVNPWFCFLVRPSKMLFIFRLNTYMCWLMSLHSRHDMLVCVPSLFCVSRSLRTCLTADCCLHPGLIVYWKVSVDSGNSNQLCFISLPLGESFWVILLGLGFLLMLRSHTASSDVGNVETWSGANE